MESDDQGLENLDMGWLGLFVEWQVRQNDHHRCEVCLGLERPSVVVLGEGNLHASSVEHPQYRCDKIAGLMARHRRTVHSRTWRLAIGEGIVRWAGWRIEAWWTLGLHVTWHAWLPLLLLLWGSQARPALPTPGHDSLKEVCRTMTDCWWRRLRCATVRARRCAWSASSLLEFVAKT